jgi:tetratricopeptide (TPR) repeat protein
MSNELTAERLRRQRKRAALLGALILAGYALLGLGVWKEPRAAASELVPQTAKPDPRFDNLVRGDMFAGMAGNQAAFDRAMKLCEDRLAKDPKHPEALVWHGSGDYFLAGRAFQRGDVQAGFELFTKSMKEMDEAVALLPNSITVLIPRAATLLEGSKHISDPAQAKLALEKALGDYEKVFEIQRTDFANLPLHSRGELLSGLADGWYRAGNAAKAQEYLKLIVSGTNGSRYAERAQAVLDSPEPPKQLQWRCIGCHISP